VQPPEARSENWYRFLRLGQKTGVGNSMLWSKIGYGFGGLSSNPLPPPPIAVFHLTL